MYNETPNFSLDVQVARDKSLSAFLGCRIKEDIVVTSGDHASSMFTYRPAATDRSMKVTQEPLRFHSIKWSWTQNIKDETVVQGRFM